MADLVTRIIADDKQFNDTINKSKQQIAAFDKSVSIIKTGMMKFAGAVGIATTAGAAFKKIIDSTQGGTDKFNSAIGQAKAGIDYFFDSIAMGNWKNLISGFDNAIARARELYDVMDALGDMQAGWSDIENEKRTKINENLAKITDPETTLSERKKLLEENDKLIADLEKKSKIISDQYAAAVVASARREAQMDNVTAADVKRYLQDISMHDDPEFYKYLKERTELQRKASETTDVSVSGNWGGTTISKSTEGAKEAKKQLEALKANNTELEKYAQINELISDTKRTEIVQLRAQGRAIDSNISALQRQQNLTKRRYGKARKGEGGDTEIIPEGSIEEVEKQLKEARKAFSNSTTDEARTAADLLIKELEAKKVVLEVQFKITDPGNIDAGTIDPVRTVSKLDALKSIDGLRDKRAGLVEKLSVTIDPASIVKLNSDIKGIDDSISALKKNFNLEIKLPDTGAGTFEGVADKSYEAVEGINSVTNALYDLSYALDEGAGAWMRWGANVLGSVGQAIPAIAALTTAKSAEATANTASAASGAASSVASIPVVGPIMAVAAVASIVAALASIPKFAFGGIVPGNSFSGDNMLARVNSGEMILNSGQQGNLFKILNGGGGNSGGTKKVELELSGRTLRAAIAADDLWRSRM